MELNNLGLRALVALFGIPLILGTIYYGKIPFLTIVLIIVTFSQYEFYKLAEKKNASPLIAPGLIIGILIPLSFYFYETALLWQILFGGILIIILIEIFRNKSNAFFNIATTVTGILYPTAAFSFLILIREYPKIADIPYKHGGLWLIFVIVTIWICDTAAYFIGSTIGKHKLFPRVSPNKTVEGAIAGFIFSIITAIVFYQINSELLNLTNYLLIAGLVGIFAQLGDLAESIFKRDANVKDSSNFLPGHGGFFDRFDAPTFIAPIIYLFIVYIVF